MYQDKELYVPIKERKLARNVYSKGLVSTDREALQEYKNRREAVEMMMNNKASTEYRLNSLEDKLTRIESLLEKLVTNVTS